MAGPKLHRLPWYVVAFAFVFAITLLAWEVTHGGVPSHHFLDRADMPTVSNWWMLIVLPVLGWLASRSVLRRAPSDSRAVGKASAAVIGAALVGIALSVAFVTTHGHGDASSYIFFAAILSGLVLPTTARNIFSASCSAWHSPSAPCCRPWPRCSRQPSPRSSIC